jgi:hypothetical protein
MKAKQTIEAKNLVPKLRKWHKTNGTLPTNSQGVYNADVLPGHSIRIYGTMTNHVKGPQEFDKVFKVGDRAEYNSWNLIYVGTITKIGEKTVTIKHYDHSAEVTMLDLFSFADKNWDFDAIRIQKHNSEESQYL